MADTRVQLEIEDWVRRDWMPQHLSQTFHRERVALSSGGVFDFDAVSADRTVVATISTSGSLTASGKYAVGKLMKIRSDMYFLLLANVQRRIVILTERDMYNRCLQEKGSGRVPSSIDFLHAELPEHLQERLRGSRQVASREVSPTV